MDRYTATGLTMCTNSGLLTATGGVTTHDTTVAIDFMIDGKLENKGTITTGTTPTTDYKTGAAFAPLIGGGSVANTPGHGTVMIWGLITGGTVKCVQGSVENLDMAGNFINAPQFPSLPEGFCPFAYQILKAGATASASGVTFGTSNWNAAGFTNAIVNIGVLPSRPRVS